MATANNSALNVSDLDFFSIKENLKTFLRSQSEFTDYDFEGSSMSVLLDLLAYNTYYNSFYLNMAANESFLDTAQLRENILSHAKNLNYVPASKQGSQAQVNINVTPSMVENNEVNYITLEKYTRLLGQDIKGVNYPFVTINANTAYKSGGSFYFPNVFIRQGEVVTLQFQANTSNPKRNFEIPSANVDTTTIVVTVQESSTNSYTEQYNLAEDLTQITANSKIFFLEENQKLTHSIYFGDDVLGKKPKDGNIINVTYLDTVGSPSNGISGFAFTSKVAGLFRDNVVISTVSASSGGTDKETNEQIKFRAPYFYSTQNRAVTKNDYENLITKDYNNIDSVTVWGGEENDPPMYGKVFLSLKTKGYYALTQLEKQRILNSLVSNRNVLTVSPEIVSPDYCFILVRGKVTYNPNLTRKSTNELLSSVRAAIQSYNDEDLNKFDSIFKISKLQQYIENADAGITGSDIMVYLQKQVDIENFKSRNYVINYNAKLKKGDLEEKIYSFPQLTVYDIQNVPRNVFFEEIPESFTGVSSIVIQNPGTGYKTTPTVVISGDGTGATGRATVVNGKVIAVDITNPGYNYSRATVSIEGDGIAASAYATIQGNYGRIRSFYYKENGEKVVVNENAGTVDYLKGTIELKSLNSLAVIENQFYDANVLTVNSVPYDEIIYPLRNRIFAIDMNNPQSIQLELAIGL